MVANLLNKLQMITFKRLTTEVMATVPLKEGK
jgi:hypothetical protein